MTETTNQQLRHFLCNKKMAKFLDGTENTAMKSRESIDSVDSTCGGYSCDNFDSNTTISATPSPSPETNVIKVEVQTEPEDLSMSTLRRLGETGPERTISNISHSCASCLDTRTFVHRTIESGDGNS